MILSVALVHRPVLNRLPRKTFLILWDILLFRLLPPVSIPSVFRIWSLFLKNNAIRRISMEAPAEIFLPAASGEPAVPLIPSVSAVNLKPWMNGNFGTDTAAAIMRPSLPVTL